MLRFTIISLCLFFLVAVCGCAATNTHVGRVAEVVAVKKAVNTYTLGNGVTLIVKETDKGSPTAIQVWVAAGSVDDPEEKPGLAHFVEHLLFTGSLHVPPGKAEEYMEGIGGELTGHTGRDYSYIGVTLAGPGWERALDILFDLAAYPSFRPEQVEKQRKVVLLEVNQRDREPDVLLIDNLFEKAYKDHPYKNRITASAADVLALTREDAAGYYTRTYVPSNITLSVVGDVKASVVRAAAEKTFGRLTPVDYKKPQVRQEPSQIYSRTKKIDGQVKLTYMALGWHVSSASDPDIYPLDVLRAVLGQGRGSRLFLELRERMAAVYDVDTELFPLRDPGMLAIVTHLREDDIPRVTSEVLRQVNKLKDEPVTDSELQRAVNGIEASILLGTETAEGQAYALGYWTTVYGGGDPSVYMANIRKVTPDDIQRVAQKYLGEGNYTLSIIKPAGQ